MNRLKKFRINFVLATITVVFIVCGVIGTASICKQVERAMQNRTTQYFFWITKEEARMYSHKNYEVDYIEMTADEYWSNICSAYNFGINCRSLDDTIDVTVKPIITLYAWGKKRVWLWYSYRITNKSGEMYCYENGLYSNIDYSLSMQGWKCEDIDMCFFKPTLKEIFP